MSDPAPDARGAAEPIGQSQRHRLVDALRGCALLGISLVNVEFIVQHADIGWGAADTTVDLAIRWAVIALGQLKIYPVFALLFGYGLAVQLDRAAERGSRLGRRYARRMLGLVILGLGHALLFFPGDILVLYAVVGAAAYPLRRLSSRTLLRVAATVYAVAAALWLTAALVLMPVSEELTVPLPPEEITTLATGSFGDVVGVHSANWAETFGFLAVLQGPAAFAFFLAGVALGRTTMLSDPSSSRPLATRVLATIGLPALVVSMAAAALVLFGGSASLLGAAIGFAVAPAMALTYLAALSLLLAPGTGRFGQLLQAGGRMSLSVYLAQSVVLSTLSYGYGAGWFGVIGPGAGVALATVVWLGLLLFSAGWLRFFRFGPAEWLLRSLSYARWQRLRA